MKIYAFYLKYDVDNEYVYESLLGLKFINEYTQEPYAITTSRKKYKEFRNTRDMNKFIYKTFHVDSNHKDEYEKMYSNKLLKTGEFLINRLGETCEVLTNDFELDAIEDFYTAIYQDIAENVSTPYDGLKEKYVKLLDILLYCSFHKSCWGSEEECIVASDNMDGYGISYEGYNCGINGSLYKYNDFNIFIELFGNQIRV